LRLEADITGSSQPGIVRSLRLRPLDPRSRWFWWAVHHQNCLAPPQLPQKPRSPIAPRPDQL